MFLLLVPGLLGVFPSVSPAGAGFIRVFPSVSPAGKGELGFSLVFLLLVRVSWGFSLVFLLLVRVSWGFPQCFSCWCRRKLWETSLRLNRKKYFPISFLGSKQPTFRSFTLKSKAPTGSRSVICSSDSSAWRNKTYDWTNIYVAFVDFCEDEGERKANYIGSYHLEMQHFLNILVFLILMCSIWWTGWKGKRHVSFAIFNLIIGLHVLVLIIVATVFFVWNAASCKDSHAATTSKMLGGIWCPHSRPILHGVQKETSK